MHCICPVSLWDFYSHGLRYAYQDATGWQIQSIDPDPLHGEYNSLALDSEGSPHTGYWARGSSLRYAQLEAATWTTQTLDAGGAHTALVLDAGDVPPH